MSEVSCTCTSIEALEVSDRVKRRLKKHPSPSITTIETLITLSERYLRVHVYQIGPGAVREIEEALEKRGLKLAEDDTRYRKGRKLDEPTIGGVLLYYRCGGLPNSIFAYGIENVVDQPEGGSNLYLKDGSVLRTDHCKSDFKRLGGHFADM